ncbi:MAG TPA: S1C family serine protease, partial [Acidimicrobiia bacterium]|nr:S1C family serine protease [Acidimicrobiia bacterium]
GRVIGIDHVTDLALIAFDATMPAAELATESAPPRASVWIVGAPVRTRADPWISAGVVSSIDAIGAIASGPTTDGLLETDANNGENSTGGALVDDHGRVAGIVIGPVSGSATVYAVPIEMAAAIAQELHATGHAEHGSMAMQGVDGAKGPTIVRLAANGPAAKAGVRTGDVVIAVGGHPVDTMMAVLARVRGRNPGSSVDLEVRRGTKDLRLHVQLAATSS